MKFHELYYTSPETGWVSHHKKKNKQSQNIR